jgi:hypothetical protein
VSSFQVSVTVTCRAEVFDAASLQTLVSKLLQTKAASDAGPGYALAGNVVSTVTVQTVSTAGVLSLLVDARGRWAYQFTRQQKTQLAVLIKGLSADQAIARLESQPGVVDVSIPGDVTTLPTDPSQIISVIQNVAGLTGGRTTPAEPPVTATTIIATPAAGGS